MSKNLNYYPGLTLSKEELQFKDYSEKYLSLFVDLIRLGGKDVLFMKEPSNFQLSKGVVGSPPNLIVGSGFCLFNKINDSIPGFEYNQTLNVNNYPDQRFFVLHDSKSVTIPSAATDVERYIYIQHLIVPAAFKCTIDSDGKINTLDGGSIKKSEILSVVRGSNSGAPTRIRFTNLGYENSTNNTGVYEISTVSEDIITVTSELSQQSTEVYCIPIGSFDLGVENNLPNRSVFAYSETNIVIDESGSLDDMDGMVKIGKIIYSSATEYEIIDLRNENKYLISIDTDVDLSDFVTKSTNQSIFGEKYFRNLIQGRINSRNASSHLISGLIDVSGEDSANDFIFDCQNQSNLGIRGFFHANKSLGTNPLNNIVPGTSIRVRFINIGSNNRFIFGAGGGFGENLSIFTGLTSNLPIMPGTTYTIRLDSVSLGSGTFSLSPTATRQDRTELQSQITQNSEDIVELNGFKELFEGYRAQGTFTPFPDGVTNLTGSTAYYRKFYGIVQLDFSLRRTGTLDSVIDIRVLPENLRPIQKFEGDLSYGAGSGLISIIIQSGSGTVTLVNGTLLPLDETINFSISYSSAI